MERQKEFPKEWIEAGILVKSIKSRAFQRKLTYEETYPERVKYINSLKGKELSYRDKMEVRMKLARWMMDRVRDMA